MKHLFILLVVSFTSVFVYGQTTVSYTYDNSGNRTSRNTIGLKSTSGATEEANSTGSFSDQIGEHAVLIYPNPVKSELLIEIQGLEETTYAEISLFDQGGRLVLTRDKIISSNTINLSHLAAGTYVMIIRLGSDKTKWTIVKE
jgi:YD repeat-containing protein